METQERKGLRGRGLGPLCAQLSALLPGARELGLGGSREAETGLPSRVPSRAGSGAWDLSPCWTASPRQAAWGSSPPHTAEARAGGSGTHLPKRRALGCTLEKLLVLPPGGASGAMVQLPGPGRAGSPEGATTEKAPRGSGPAGPEVMEPPLKIVLHFEEKLAKKGKRSGVSESLSPDP